MNINKIILLNLIVIIKLIYGQSNIINECAPVNKLMGLEDSFDCCSNSKVVCSDGHVTEL